MSEANNANDNDNNERLSVDVFPETGDDNELTETEFNDWLLSDDTNSGGFNFNVNFSRMRNPSKVLETMTTLKARPKIGGIYAEFDKVQDTDLALRFANSLSLWSGLWSLTMHDFHGTPEIFERIGDALQLNNITLLDLRHCDMTDELGKLLLQPIHKATHLTQIVLDNVGTNFTQEFIGLLVQALDGRTMNFVNVHQEQLLDYSALNALCEVGYHTSP